MSEPRSPAGAGELTRRAFAAANARDYEQCSFELARRRSA
jgi:hypothetical protein